MAIELPEGRSESHDVLDALRLRAVHARELGYAVIDSAAILGVGEETVSRWCSRYDHGGQEALGDRHELLYLPLSRSRFDGDVVLWQSRRALQPRLVLLHLLGGNANAVRILAV
jgi:Helix-turn-helix domain